MAVKNNLYMENYIFFSLVIAGLLQFGTSSWETLLTMRFEIKIEDRDSLLNTFIITHF